MSQQANNRKNGRRRQNRRRINPKTSLVRQPNNPIPPSITVNMRYSDTQNLVNTSGVYTYNVYRMNSTFDPDYSGAGHQPYGRDQLAALYTKYRVNEFIWDIEALPEAAAISSVACHPTAGAGSPGSTEAQSEFPYGENRICSLNGPSGKFRGRLPLRQWLGQSKANFEADDSNEALAGSSPTATAYFVVGSQSTNLATTNTVRVSIDLTFNVTWFAPYPLAQS